MQELTIILEPRTALGKGTSKLKLWHGLMPLSIGTRGRCWAAAPIMTELEIAFCRLFDCRWRLCLRTEGSSGWKPVKV